MKISILLAAVVSVLLAFVAFWVFFPTAIGATQQTFRVVSPRDFSQMRSDALSFQRSVALNGVELIAGDERTDSFGFLCKGVPVLTVMNGPQLLVVQSTVDADERAPGVIEFRDKIVSGLTPAGASLVPKDPISVPSGVEAFVLKHRDGLDVSTNCRE